MYSTAPLPDPNQGHTGFIFAFVLFCFFALFAYALSIDDHQRNTENRYKSWSLKNSPIFVIWIVLTFSLLVVTFYESFLRKVPAPKNEVVIAELFDLDVKMVQKNAGSSKHPKWQAVQQGFLVYKTPDGYLTLPNKHMQVVHPRIILYKN